MVSKKKKKSSSVPSLIRIRPVVVEKNFLVSSMYICYFVIIFPWGEMRGLSFEETWNLII